MQYSCVRVYFLRVLRHLFALIIAHAGHLRFSVILLASPVILQNANVNHRHIQCAIKTQVWIGLLSVAIVMWVLVRMAYVMTLAEWRELAAATDKEEQADEWAATRRSVWRAKRRLMNMQREA